MKNKKDKELYNLFRGDYLLCQSCHNIVWMTSFTAASFRFKEVDKAYYNHVKECFGLKRLYVKSRV